MAIELSRFNKLCVKIPERSANGDHQVRCRNCNSVYKLHPTGLIVDCDNQMLDDCPHCIHKTDAILDRETQEQMSKQPDWGAF